MANDRGSGDDTGSSVLNQLEFVEEIMGETEKKGVAVIQTGGDEGVNQDCSTVGSE